MHGKVTLITGASSGIGQGTAVFFAAKGCKLSLTGRNNENLQKTHQDCVKAGANAEDILLIPADLRKEEDIRSIIEKTIDKFGKLDILVNNAGLARRGKLDVFPMEDYDAIFEVNVRSVFYLTQLAVPHLIKTKGNVVCISSVAGLRPSPLSIAYCMSKAALDHFVRISALDLASKQVRVNGVNPGYIPTSFQRNADPSSIYKFNPEAAIKCHALGRAGTVEEIARAIAFLADDKESAFITGVSLPVDGGNILMGPM